MLKVCGKWKVCSIEPGGNPSCFEQIVNSDHLKFYMVRRLKMLVKDRETIKKFTDKIGDVEFKYDVHDVYATEAEAEAACAALNAAEEVNGDPVEA